MQARVRIDILWQGFGPAFSFLAFGFDASRRRARRYKA
jgi:hypothetical protein